MVIDPAGLLADLDLPGHREIHDVEGGDPAGAEDHEDRVAPVAGEAGGLAPGVEVDPPDHGRRGDVDEPHSAVEDVGGHREPIAVHEEGGTPGDGDRLGVLDGMDLIRRLGLDARGLYIGLATGDKQSESNASTDHRIPPSDPQTPCP